MKKYGKKVKLNVYKILNEQKSDLKDYLEERGLKSIASKQFRSYNLEFYFNKKEDGGNVWWMEYFSNFFEGIDTEEYQKTAYYGVLIATSSTFTFAISYGNAHFYLQNYCDLNFGLNLAERIVDKNSINVKSSKYFNVDKSKELTTYSKKVSIEFDSGEASHYIDASPIDKKTFGSKIQFSYAVNFNIDLHPNSIVSLLSSINKSLKKKPLFKVPRVNFIRESSNQQLITRLNEQLIDNIKKENVNVNLSKYKIIGSNFILDNSYRYELQFSRKKEELDDINISIIKQFITTNKILAIELKNVRVKYWTDNDNIRELKLLQLLDFTVTFEGINYCILDGKWATFNEAYIDYLNTIIDKINQQSIQNVDYNFYEKTIANLKKKTTENLNYNEYIYNKYYMTQKNFECIDREFYDFAGHKVELGDLINKKDKSILHVKIGSPSTLSYCLDQSKLYIKLMQNSKEKIKILNKHKISEINKIGIILIFENKSLRIGSIDLKNIKSIIFKVKLVDWFKEIQRSDFEPVIYLNVKRK